eukprot:12358264-Alexandrium_andersonii.AAC.1
MRSLPHSRQLRHMGFQCHVLHRSHVHAPSIGGGGGACSAVERHGLDGGRYCQPPFCWRSHSSSDSRMSVSWTRCLQGFPEGRPHAMARAALSSPALTLDPHQVGQSRAQQARRKAIAA